MQINLSVHGCDDSTYVTIEATEEQFTFLQSIAEKVNEASTYGCMPTMVVEKAK